MSRIYCHYDRFATDKNIEIAVSKSRSSRRVNQEISKNAYIRSLNIGWNLVIKDENIKKDAIPQS